MTEEQIDIMIQQATAERDTFIQQANERVAFQNGRIQALQDMRAALTVTAGDESAAPQLPETTNAD